MRNKRTSQRKEYGSSNYTEQAKTEDTFTKAIEDVTVQIPSSVYFGIAIGAMGLSLVCQATGRGKLRTFIAQWVPTWLIIGLYNKFVKLEGHDQYDFNCGQTLSVVKLSNTLILTRRCSA